MEMSAGDILEARAVDSIGCDTGDHCHCKRLRALFLEMEAHSLEVLNVRLAGALGSFIWWVTTLPTAGRMELDVL